MLTIKTVNGCGKQCDQACQMCEDCQGESRGWSDCWKHCDACNRCKQRAFHTDRYGWTNYQPPNEYVTPPEKKRYPIAKQYCDNVCGVRVCRRYRERMDGYNQCKRCEQLGMCWSDYQSRCVQCPSLSYGPGHCEAKWGSPNPLGAQFAYVPPINPMNTNCKPWWNPSSYTT